MTHSTPRRPSVRRVAGFTLVEVLFAMAILAIGLLAVASLLPVAALQQKRAIDDVSATSFGQSVLATLRGGGRTVITNASPTANYYVVNGTIDPAYSYADPNGIYSYKVAYRMPTNGDPIQMAVFVYREPSAGSPYSVTLNTPPVVLTASDVDNSYSGQTDGTVFKYKSTVNADLYRKNQTLLVFDSTNLSKVYTAKVVSLIPTGTANQYHAKIVPKLTSLTSGAMVYFITNTGSSTTMASQSSVLCPTIVEGVIP